MKILIMIFTIVLNVRIVCAEILETECRSKSGQSIYNLKLNLETNSGKIRYRFMEQDIYYTVRFKNNENKLIGIADFEKSNTGETKGNTFDFIYYKEEKALEELNVKAICN